MIKLTIKEIKALLKKLDKSRGSVSITVKVIQNARGNFIEYSDTVIKKCRFMICDKPQQDNQIIIELTDLLKGLNLIKKELNIDIIDNQLILKENKKSLKISEVDEVYSRYDIPNIDKTSRYSDFNYNLVEKSQSKDETRHYLCGVYFDNNLVCSTDGRRLHVMNTNLNQEFSTIIPTSIYNIFGVLDLKTFELSNFIGDSTINNIKSDKIDITFENINGNYPDITKITIEKQGNYVDYIAVNRLELIEALKSFKDAKLNKNKFIKFDIENNNLKLHMENLQYTMTLSEILSCESVVEYGDTEFGLNYEYLLEVLSQIQGDSLEIYAKNFRNSPINIKDGENHFVIMPVKV